jgi:hypothetical protein
MHLVNIVVLPNDFAALFDCSANFAICSADFPVTILILFRDSFKSCAYPYAS